MALHRLMSRKHGNDVCYKPAHLRSFSVERQTKRKPFSNWVKRIANLKGNDDADGNKKKRAAKQKKGGGQNGTWKNNPYPKSGALRPPGSPVSSNNGALSFTTSEHVREEERRCSAVGGNRMEEHGPLANGTRSNAPTLATKAETVHSDAGHSKAATATTGAGALSSNDGAGGAGSTFSSPAPSERSLTTTLTTIQSQSPAVALQSGSSSHNNQHHHGMLNNPNPVQFSHQYPTSPTPSSMMAASAIPRHIAEGIPTTYNSATANNLLTDNASILTLASSSKQRRRRSMDTDASVRAIPPSSVWGGSRESLPLSVLSGNADGPTSGQANLYTASQSRPSIGGLAGAERASVYSSQGVSAPALASERNSYYAHKPKDLADGKSLRSLTNIDARSQYDARSIKADDARSQLGDVASLKNYEGSVRSGMLGAGGHGRSDSIPGSPLASPGPQTIRGQASASGAVSRRSSDWLDEGEEGKEE